MNSKIIEFFESKWTPKPNSRDKNNYYGDCYVLYNRDSKRYKIGISQSLENRINKITTESGCLIDLVMRIKSEGSVYPTIGQMEEILHRYFNNKRYLGEWFDLNKSDLMEIYFLFTYIRGIETEMNLADHFDFIGVKYCWDEFLKL